MKKTLQNIWVQKDPIINSFIEAYACGELHSESTYLNGKSLPWGAGLVVRSKFTKTLYEELNFKSILSDRKGNALSSGGDTEFLLPTEIIRLQMAI